LGFAAVAFMASSTARKMVQQGRGTQRTRSTTPTLFTPLQAIYTRPSGVAARAKLHPFANSCNARQAQTFGTAPSSRAPTFAIIAKFNNAAVVEFDAAAAASK
jgi:hypothetical protein